PRARGRSARERRARRGRLLLGHAHGARFRALGGGLAMTTTTMPDRPTFASLLEAAVSQPGVIARAYSAFHSFSFGNQLLAAMHCAERGVPVGALASFQAWKGKGRHVKRGERALWLWMPLTCKRTVTQDDGTEETELVTRFALKPHWFVYAQTGGRELAPAPIPV